MRTAHIIISEGRVSHMCHVTRKFVLRGLRPGKTQTVMPSYTEASQSVGTTDMGRVKRIWYLSPMRAAKVQASLRIRAVSPEPPLLAHTSSESRGTFRQKARSLAPLNGWACVVKICHDRMLEDTNLLDASHIATAGIILSGQGTTKTLIRLWGCAG